MNEYMMSKQLSGMTLPPRPSNITQTSFVNELLSTTTDDDSDSFGFRTAIEDIVSFGTNLSLFEELASSQDAL